MNLSLAIVIGATLIAAAIALSHRYDLSSVAPVSCNATQQCVGAWRADNWTGEVAYCEYNGQNVSQRAICQKVRYWSERE